MTPLNYTNNTVSKSLPKIIKPLTTKLNGKVFFGAKLNLAVDKMSAMVVQVF